MIYRYQLTCALPRQLIGTLPLTHRMHRALIKLSDGDPIFTGHDRNGQRTLGHRHASILAVARGARDWITELAVALPVEPSPAAIEALARLERLNGHYPVDLNLMGGFAASSCEHLVGPSRRWLSHTPFYSTRRPTRRMENGLRNGSPEHDLRRLLTLAGHGPVTRIEHLPAGFIGGRRISWDDFVPRRPEGRGRVPDSSQGCGFVIEFAEPEAGPISVGYGSHFGAGLFLPTAQP